MFLSRSLLYLSDDSVRLGQPGYAHAVYGYASVGLPTKLCYSPHISRKCQCALHCGSFIII